MDIAAHLEYVSENFSEISHKILSTICRNYEKNKEYFRKYVFCREKQRPIREACGLGALKRKVTKIQSTYMEKHEEQKIRAARRKKLLIRRLTVFSIFAGIISYVLISSLVSQHRTLE